MRDCGHAIKKSFHRDPDNLGGTDLALIGRWESSDTLSVLKVVYSVLMTIVESGAILSCLLVI